MVLGAIASRGENQGSQDSFGVKNDIFSKSPTTLSRNNFMRMSLRNTLFKKSKPKTYILEGGSGRGSRASFRFVLRYHVYLILLEINYFILIFILDLISTQNLCINF